MTDSIDLARVVRPTSVSRSSFQVGILDATTSINDCLSARLSPLSDTGIPWRHSAREHLLNGHDRVVVTVNGRDQALLLVGDKARGTYEELQDLGQAIEITCCWRQQNDEIVHVQQSTGNDNLYRQQHKHHLIDQPPL